jgi:hypothetical protein
MEVDTLRKGTDVNKVVKCLEVLSFGKDKKSFASTGIRAPYITARSLVTILTSSRLQIG